MRSTHDHDGYITDTAYPHHFQREITPVWLNFVATALGRPSPDLRAPYAWCELGCGQGFAAVLAAAANPNGRFVAVDVNAAHIAHGRGLAQAAGLGNLTFVESAFQDLAQAAQALPAQYDYIVVHGVYSWVSAANRQAIRQFIQQQLKPGGIAYIGYMAQPGLAFFSAPQRFLRQFARTLPGSSAERVRAALRALQRLHQTGSGLFAEDAAIGPYLERALQQDPAYLAHELLNEHWDALHVADVIASVEADGGVYIGSATPLENIDELSLPGNVMAQLHELEDGALRETLKDLARNQSDRRDLYQYAAPALDAQAHRSALLDQVVAALPGAPADGGLTFATRIGPVTGAASLFSPLLQALAGGPQGFADLARLPALSGQLGGINPALQALAWAGHLHPLLPGQVDVPGCQALNRVISERVLHGASYAHLAAPSLGSAVSADFIEMAAARVLLDHPQLRGARLRETVDALLRRVGWRARAQVDEPLQVQLERFERQTLPIWQQLGVLGS